jgi:hypothetical protein
MHEALVLLQEKMGAESVSAVIREIVDSFDFAAVDAERSEHRQISVRIDSDKRKLLLRLAKQKRTSAGELLRRAILSFKPVRKSRKG